MQERFPLPAMKKKAIRAGVLCAMFVAMTEIVGGCAPFPRNQPPDLVKVIQFTSPAVVAIGDERGILGSGFRLADSRWVVTAAHVVTSAPSGSPVVVWDAKHWPARLVHVDKDSDLALLELTADAPMPGLTLAESSVLPAAGEWIVVLGCPFGARATATVGIVSAAPGAILEPPSLRKLMQLNAAVNPGNSGGPVVNLDGKVVGIANATIPGGFGLGFATPISALADLLAAQGRGP